MSKAYRIGFNDGREYKKAPQSDYNIRNIADERAVQYRDEMETYGLLDLGSFEASYCMEDYFNGFLDGYYAESL